MLYRGGGYCNVNIADLLGVGWGDGGVITVIKDLEILRNLGSHGYKQL